MLFWNSRRKKDKPGVRVVDEDEGGVDGDLAVHGEEPVDLIGDVHSVQ